MTASEFEWLEFLESVSEILKFKCHPLSLKISVFLHLDILTMFVACDAQLGGNFHILQFELKRGVKYWFWCL